MSYKKSIVTTQKHSYSLIEYIDSGGSSVVWKAKRLSDGAIFAIKILDSIYLSTKKKSRFENELEFQKKSKCKYIVPVLDDGYFDTENKIKRFYVMPYYKYNLRSYKKEFNPTPQMIIKQFISICKAVAYAHKHKQNVIHRDIKPENIFYSEESDHMLLGDFGIAHFKEYDLTTTAQKLANFDYHAPEQSKNSKYTIGTYTDIYALGLILNELFTDDIPKGNNYKIVREVQPSYYFLDSIIDLMMDADVFKRTNDANDVIHTIKLENVKIKQKISDMKQSVIQSSTNKNKSRKLTNVILEDFMITNYMFSDSRTRWNDINRNYHMNIHYNCSPMVINTCIILSILKNLKSKFDYESNVYSRDNFYNALNLKNTDDKKIYDEFCDYLDGIDVYERFNHLKREALKYFSSVEDYHAKEIIRDLDSIENLVRRDLENAPLLWISYYVRPFYDEYINMYGYDFEINDWVGIIWDETKTKLESDNLYDVYDIDKEKQMILLIGKYVKTVSISQNQHRYELVFKSNKEFQKYKKLCKDIIEKHKNNYVFGGDVEDVYRMTNVYENYIVVSMDQFGFFKTLPKVFGETKID